jgi:dipeptidase E
VLVLSGKKAPRVLYLGTATYDDPAAGEAQTHGFRELGASVSNLSVAYQTPSPEVLKSAFSAADIVVVSGGNTLFAVDRWKRLGIDKMIRAAGARGATFAGGSAGGISWFDGGASDSMDPRTYKNPPGPLLNPHLNDTTLATMWAYIRVPALGTLPGLFCPHYDITEGNGELRSTMFTNMLRHHTGESGLAVDNWAAFVVDGAEYRIVSRAGKTGSVGPGGHFTSNSTTGRPGAWVMSINETTGELQRDLVPASGRVEDLLHPARYVAPDALLPVARRQNPDDGLPPTGPGL